MCSIISMALLEARNVPLEAVMAELAKAHGAIGPRGEGRARPQGLSRDGSR